MYQIRKLLLYFLTSLASPFFLINAKDTSKVNRPTSYPFISGDTFRLFCTFIIDEKENNFSHDKLRNGDTIFLKGDENYLDYFFKNVHPNITKKYVLITHNSDGSIPGKYEQYLKSDKLVAWFGQNVSKKIAKLYPIPIGIENAHWKINNTSIIKEITELHVKKNKLLYLNFNPKTNRQKRENVVAFFAHKPFCTKVTKKPFKQYLKDLAESHFIVSPNGNGIDCHRTWEALLCGSIPIVEQPADNSLFTDLPVIIINSWSEVTEEFLHKKLEELSKRTFNFKKLYIDYWFDLMRQKQKKCK